MNIDFIGDVHGYDQLLEKLLNRLDYTNNKGVYTHPIQKTIFVGDLINRGPSVKRVLKMVFDMCESGQARCILGNHELNFLAYQLNKKKRFLTEIHLKRIEKQLETTLLSFKNDEKGLIHYYNWIKTFPLHIEEKNFRVIHACWNQKSVNQLKTYMPSNTLSDELIIKLMNEKSKEYGLFHFLYKGIDIPLFKGDSISDSTPVRIRWWKNMEGKTYRDMATKERQHIPDKRIPERIITRAYKYNKEDPLLFVGHFCLDELPHLVSNNVCCLDFCVSKKGVLSAYRLLAEKKLKSEHLYYVQDNK